jgi:hypothetical protein
LQAGQAGTHVPGLNEVRLQSRGNGCAFIDRFRTDFQIRIKERLVSEKRLVHDAVLLVTQINLIEEAAVHFLPSREIADKVQVLFRKILTLETVVLRVHEFQQKCHGKD